MTEKKYKCFYKYCLHPDSEVSASESVIINKKHYHWDCAMIKQEIQECVKAYIRAVGDNSLYGVTTRIINVLVFKNRIPTEYILNEIQSHQKYYKSKPVQILYGIRKEYWENNK